jgi:hypothetical protein
MDDIGAVNRFERSEGLVDKVLGKEGLMDYNNS